MGFLVGTDEAGYGPNLGPLVIAATLWQLDRPPREDDLRERFGPRVFCDAPAADARAALAIADSKRLYSPQRGLACLEEGVLSLLNWAGLPCTSLAALRSAIAPTAAERFAAEPWLADYELPLPLAAEAERIEAHARRLHEAAPLAGARLIAVRCRVLFARQFNALADEAGNKATLLSEQTLSLVAELIAPLRAPVLVLCDRHGGRRRYASLVQQLLSREPVRVVAESASSSVYRFGRGDEARELQFHVGCERYLSAAAASMVAKYLRELTMAAFNAFWCAQVADLRPTAGYAVDARRFKTQIASCQKSLGIADGDLWRSR